MNSKENLNDENILKFKNNKKVSQLEGRVEVLENKLNLIVFLAFLIPTFMGALALVVFLLTRY